MAGPNRFRKVLCLSLHPRADYTRALLSSLRLCAGIENYLILANIEEGSDETLALALNVNFAEIDIGIKPRAQNSGERAFVAIERGFRKAEFVSYLDGDTTATADYLRYLEYAAGTFRDDPDVFLASGHGGNDKAKHRQIARRPVQFGSALGIWRNRWEWSKRTGRAKGSEFPAELTKFRARYGLQEVFPLLSRCRRLEQIIPHVDLPKTVDFREAYPSVTAVMITGLHRERYAMARVAIDCFKRQTYPNKSLLIVNHGEESLFPNDPRIRELRLLKSRWDTVGDLRNLALEHATSDYILNWDDDDWHHPLRMEVQMRARREDAAVLLKTRIHHSLVNGRSRYAEYPNGAEATILHPRKVDFRYPSLLRGSDTVFAQQFAVRLPIENDPALHIRLFHGKNLWDEGHIMGTANDASLRDEHIALLRAVLPLYSKRLSA